LLCGAVGGCDGFGIEQRGGKGKRREREEVQIVLRSFPFVRTVLISRHELLG
jgi:hypothetical protein